MKTLKEKKLFFYIRISFCMLLVLVWVVWLINLPKSENREQKSEIRNQRNLTNSTNLTPTLQPHNPQSTIRDPKKLKVLSIEFPRLVTLQHAQDRGQRTEKRKENSDVSSFAEATRNILLAKKGKEISEVKNETSNADLKLRKGINEINQKKIEEWIPRYLKAKQSLINPHDRN